MNLRNFLLKVISLALNPNPSILYIPKGNKESTFCRGFFIEFPLWMAYCVYILLEV